MVTEYVSPAQKGMKINTIITWLAKLLSDNKLALPSSTLVDVNARVEEAQGLINEIAGTRINVENPVVGTLADATMVSMIHAAGLELQMLAGRKLKDKLDRVEFVFGRSMLNIVIGKPYRLLGIAYTKRGEKYYLGLSAQGHYVFSDESNWEEIPEQAA